RRRFSGAVLSEATKAIDRQNCSRHTRHIVRSRAPRGNMTARSRDWTWPTSAATVRQLLFVILVIAALAACAAKPFVLEGNANFARITYDGNMESATAAAKRHCAPFERVPQFRELEESVAYFDCVRP